MSIVGITLISILSGFGVVNTPFHTWSSYKRKVSEQDYVVAEHAYRQTESIIKEKRALLERMQSQQDRKEKPVKGFLNKVTSVFRGSDQSGELMCIYRYHLFSSNIFLEIALLQTEIEQLEGLAVHMKSDLDELERGRVSDDVFVNCM